MKSYYEILEVEPGVHEREIKRAYFRAIRKYPPDKEKEAFQNIRKAYETLMDSDGRREYDQSLCVEPEFQSAYSEIRSLMKSRRLEAAEECAVEVLDHAEIKEFRALLGWIYILKESFGKAVKSFEQAVKLDPDNIDYSEGLLLAYWNRGWCKKALEVCKGLEIRDCRLAEFYLSYGGILYNRGAKAAAVKKLETAAGLLNEGTYNSEVLCEAWVKLFQEGCRGDEDFLTECFRIFNGFISICSYDERKLGEMVEKVSLNFLEDMEISAGLENGIKELMDNLMKRGEAVLKEPRLRLLIETVPRKLEAKKIKKDSRIPRKLHELVETFYAGGVAEAMKGSECGSRDYEEIKEAVILAKLAVIESFPGIKKGFKIIKDEYPYCRQDMGEFLDEVVKAGSKAKLLNKYEKQFDKIRQVMMDNLFYSMAGFDEAEPFGNDLDEFWEEDFFNAGKTEPYQRKEPKIGRNAPCPCGSGKKYKNCCGKNC